MAILRFITLLHPLKPSCAWSLQPAGGAAVSSYKTTVCNRLSSTAQKTLHQPDMHMNADPCALEVSWCPWRSPALTR